MILPATQSILNTNFRGRDRAIAFGIWGATIGGMAAIGPLIGGWLTTNLPGAGRSTSTSRSRSSRSWGPCATSASRGTRTPSRGSTRPASCSSPSAWRLRLRPDRGPHLRLVDAGDAVHDPRLDVAAGHLDHPVHARVRPRRDLPVPVVEARRQRPASSSCSMSACGRSPPSGTGTSRARSSPWASSGCCSRCRCSSRPSSGTRRSRRDSSSWRWRRRVRRRPGRCPGRARWGPRTPSP